MIFQYFRSFSLSHSLVFLQVGDLSDYFIFFWVFSPSFASRSKSPFSSSRTCQHCFWKYRHKSKFQQHQCIIISTLPNISLFFHYWYPIFLSGLSFYLLWLRLWHLPQINHHALEVFQRYKYLWIKRTRNFTEDFSNFLWGSEDL